MTKISKILTAAAALGVMGVAIIPAAGYAATGVGSANVTVELEVVASDDTTGATGGNNAKGYTWSTKDSDGTKLNMSVDGDHLGSSTVGITPMGAAAASITNDNTYGIKYTAEADTVTTLTNASTNYLPVTGSDVTIASSTSAGTVKAWDTVGPDKSLVTLGAKTNTSLSPGIYYNTVTITATPKS